jgi:hypothetical protein
VKPQGGKVTGTENSKVVSMLNKVSLVGVAIPQYIFLSIPEQCDAQDQFKIAQIRSSRSAWLLFSKSILLSSKRRVDRCH